MIRHLLSKALLFAILECGVSDAEAREEIARFHIGLPEDWENASLLAGSLGTGPQTERFQVEFRETFSSSRRTRFIELSQKAAEGSRESPPIATCAVTWTTTEAKRLVGKVSIDSKLPVRLAIARAPGVMLILERQNQKVREPIVLPPGNYELLLHATKQ